METDITNRLRNIVFDSLRDLLGDKTPTVIDEQMNVVKALGLQSEDGLDLACILSIRLGFEIPHDVNPLFDDDTRGGRTVGEIINLVAKLWCLRPEAKHA